MTREVGPTERARKCVRENVQAKLNNWNNKENNQTSH